MNALKLVLGFFVVGLVSWVRAGVEFKEADITTVKNIVERNEGTGAVPARVNDKIYENSKVTTSAASMAELTFADSSITRMGANTEFSFQSKERLVKLNQGTVLIHTPPGNGGATVDCGGVTAAVTGTTFMASHDTVGNVMFVLLEGQGGLKVTVGGSTTTIRPGQAASIGADVKKEMASKDNSALPAGDNKSAAPGQKSEDPGGSENSPGAAKKTVPTAPGGGEGGGLPAPSPKIQVFEVDVKKIVTTTPLIVEFKTELPSVSKIEKVIDVQQAKVQEGKIEKTETEIVLIKHEDGDVLVGAPMVKSEETVVINRKEDKVGLGGGGNNLDVETAAGPGVGGNDATMAAAPPPRVDAPIVAAPPPPPPVVNLGQIVNQQPITPVVIAVTAKVDDVTRPFNQPNPAFGFSITSGSLSPGHSLVTGYLTPAGQASDVAGGPYEVSFLNPRIVDAGGTDVTSRYNLTTLAGVLNVVKAPQNLSLGFAGDFLTGSIGRIAVSGIEVGAPNPTFSILETDGRATVDSAGVVTVGKILGADSFTLRATSSGNDNYNSAQQEVIFGISPDPAGLLQANVARRLLHGPTVTAEFDALQKFFYYTGKLATYAKDAPQAFWQDVRSTIFDLGQLRTVAQPFQLYTGQSSTYFMMGDLVTGGGARYQTDLQGKNTVIFANSVRLGINPQPAQTMQGSPQTTIPDGTAAGLTSRVNLASLGASSTFGWFVDRVGLNVSGNPVAYGAFNGDFVSGLRYTDAAGVSRNFNLLNRIGSSATDPDGSDSNGLRITLNDFADGAVHDAVPAGVSTGEIVGSYRPGSGLDLLGLGLGPVKADGTMELFMADVSSGAQGILDSWSVSLVQRLAINLENAAGKNLTLVAGDGGMQIAGTLWNLGGASAEFMTTGDLKLFADDFYHPASEWRAEAAGSAELASVRVLGDEPNSVEADVAAKGDVSLVDTTIKGISGDLNIQSLNGAVKLSGSKEVATDMTTVPVLVSGNTDLESSAKVKISGSTLVDIPTNAGVGQDTGTSTAPSSNLAVIRTGDSLELRNVTVSGFSETRLEKVSPTTKALQGRVLISGSAVRDFKIKELVGAAVNADAKIQMAALDSQGQLEGEMKLEGELPVAAKLAKEIDTAITGPLGDTAVHAKSVELAARNLNFNGASIAAMESITARANTILVQNSFMTVVRNSGMINMYVSSGLVNRNSYSLNSSLGYQSGQVNFAGLNKFQIGSTYFEIGSEPQLNAALGNNLIEIPSGGQAQRGKVNVMKL